MRLLGLALLTIVLLACSEDPDLERRGGAPPVPNEDPVDMMPGIGGNAGEGMSGGAAGVESGGAGEVVEPPAVAFCDALAVVRDKCQRCHTEPLKNGAPVPFLTFEDFQAPYGSSGSTYGEVAIRAVEQDVMPYVALNEPPSNIMPPVEPLTVEEKDTLLTWLKQGRQPVGGTDCP